MQIEVENRTGGHFISTYQVETFYIVFCGGGDVLKRNEFVRCQPGISQTITWWIGFIILFLVGNYYVSWRGAWL